MRPSWGCLYATVLGVCLVAPSAAIDQPVRLAGSTRFKLELAHHISSGRTPPGSPVFFRVADDVVAGGRTVIRKGTVVEGRMQATGERGMVGTSGMINFGVRYVPAVDGQNVRVLASVSNKGRSRDGATLGWVFMWGIFGLTTKGVDAFALRGAELEAEVLSDRDIGAALAPTPATAESVAGTLALGAARLGKSKTSSLVVSLERATEKRPLTFDLPAGPAIASAAIVSVNGRSTIAPIAALSTTPERIEFDLWEVIKYCDDGDNALRFELAQPDGRKLEATYSLTVELKRKKP